MTMTRNNKKPIVATTAAIMLSLGMAGNINQVIAGSDTANLTVSANVNAKCKLGSPSPVAFGSYDPVETNATAPLDATGSFTVQCTKGSNATLAINTGLYSNSASGTSRAMKAASSANDYLNYELYTSGGRTTVWNDTTNTVAYGPAANASPYTETVYGRVPGGQVNATAGSYSDTVTITVTY